MSAAIVAIIVLGFQGFAHYEFKNEECEVSITSLRAVTGATIEVKDCNLVVGVEKTDSTDAASRIK